MSSITLSPKKTSEKNQGRMAGFVGPPKNVCFTKKVHQKPGAPDHSFRAKEFGPATWTLSTAMMPPVPGIEGHSFCIIHGEKLCFGKFWNRKFP